MLAAGIVAAAALASCSGGPPTTRGSPAPPTTSAPPEAALTGGATPVPAPTGPTVSPPTTIDARCASDVSAALQSWLGSLPPSTTVRLASGACYRVDEGIALTGPQGLTVYGGTFRNDSTAATGRSKGSPVFTVFGGSRVAFEAMHLAGANDGGYHARLAFAGGIEVEGTAQATIRGVTIADTFGDGITLAPLRGGADHRSGHIVAPATNVVVRDVTVRGAGRQGVTFASVDGATLEDVVVTDPGLDTFDFEADQGDEGARNVTIDGCAASGGVLFFANGGAGSGKNTGNVTVEHCTMAKPEGGSAVLVQRPGAGTTLRGPFVFSADELWCGASAYVACVQLTGGQVTLSGVTLRFPRSTTHEAVYHLGAGSTAAFENDVVDGYGRRGSSGPGSNARVSGGRWTPASSR